MATRAGPAEAGGAKFQIRLVRLLVRDGRIALSIGIIFLFVCISIRQVAHSFGSGTVSEIIAEGMLIAGRVAMWRPLEILLYDWWPIRRRTRVFGKLGDACGAAYALTDAALPAASTASPTSRSR
jgi:hypothetical protein